MITTSILLALISHCGPLINSLEKNENVEYAWSRESNCLREVREGRAPEVLEALAHSTSDTAALLRCELRLSAQAFDHGLASTTDLVIARCLINAAIADPSTLTRAAIERVSRDELQRAIGSVSPDEFVLLGPLIELADRATLEWRAQLYAVLCDRIATPAAACAEYAARYPYSQVVSQMNNRKARYDEYLTHAAASDRGEKFIRTGLILAVDAALITTTVLLRDHPLAGQISATVSATLGLAPLGALLGGLIGSVADEHGWSFFYGTIIGAAVGAVGGAVLGAALTTTPGASRPITAGASLGIGTAVLIPFVWIF